MQLLGLVVDKWLLGGVQAVHHTWKSPDSWRPQRFMPKGEYDSFDEDIRQYMVGTCKVV